MRLAPLLVTLSLLVAACGDGLDDRVSRTTPPSAAPSSSVTGKGRWRFVRPPVVQIGDGRVRATVRLNRGLPGGNAPRADIAVSGAAADVPGLFPTPRVRRCYTQELIVTEQRPRPREDEPVSVTLTIRGSRGAVLRATVPAERSRLTDEANAAVARQLGCPAAPPVRDCDGQAVDRDLTIGVGTAGGGATCADAQRVLDEVATWIDSRRCFEDLCVRRHRMNAGYRCTVATVGEADWLITCRRGKRVVTGSTAE